MQYNKLIRDRIPEIITASGKQAQIETMDEEGFRSALLEKLVEEATEVRDAAPEERATELADLLEVFETILSTFGLTMVEVREVQERRRAERGGFEKRLRLLTVEPLKNGED